MNVPFFRGPPKMVLARWLFFSVSTKRVPSKRETPIPYRIEKKLQVWVTWVPCLRILLFDAVRVFSLFARATWVAPWCELYLLVG